MLSRVTNLHIHCNLLVLFVFKPHENNFEIRRHCIFA